MEGRKEERSFQKTFGIKFEKAQIRGWVLGWSKKMKVRISRGHVCQNVPDVEKRKETKN